VAFIDILGPGRFAAGMLTYTDRFGRDPNTRIVVPVTFEHIIITTAVLDTGAPWCVLNPEEAVALNLNERVDCGTSGTPLRLRGMSYHGRLCRIPVSLNAERGKGMTVEATVFVPTLTPGESWLHPNFLGLDGLLNRLRFAIDPEQNHFFFAPLGEE
jgi:hypothetical protein